MPYIDKNGKPILWEEVNYANQYKKALIYYPVKAKTISGTPVPTYYLQTEGGDDLITQGGDNLVWFPV